MEDSQLKYMSRCVWVWLSVFGGSLFYYNIEFKIETGLASFVQTMNTIVLIVEWLFGVLVIFAISY